MDKRSIESQIKTNKFRVIVGVISLIAMWVLFTYKELLFGLYLYLVIGFSVITLIMYVVFPLIKNKKLKKELNE